MVGGTDNLEVKREQQGTYYMPIHIYMYKYKNHQNAMLSHYTSQTGLNVTFDFLKFSQ